MVVSAFHTGPSVLVAGLIKMMQDPGDASLKRAFTYFRWYVSLVGSMAFQMLPFKTRTPERRYPLRLKYTFLAMTTVFAALLCLSGCGSDSDSSYGEQDFASVQVMYDELHAKWTTPSFTGPSDSGVLAHVGLFGDPSSAVAGKTWDPRPCAAGDLAWESGVGKVPANCGPNPNQHYNIYSIIPSTMSAQKPSVPGENARGKLYVPDSGSVGCNDPSIPCPALTSAGIIMDPTSTSWLCAYPGDVGSNTWDRLCPVRNGITPEAFNPTVITNQCGTCGSEMDSYPFSDACRDSKAVPTGCDFKGVASTPGLMHTGPSSSYYPYNEFDVASSNVDGPAVKAIFYVENAPAELQGEADAREALEQYKDDNQNEIPLIKWFSDEVNPTWTCMNCQ